MPALAVSHRRQRTMDAILDGAAAVFHDLGVEGATMDEIALSAKVARATLYYNFASKDEIAIALAERYRSAGYSAFQKLRDAGAPADALLREFFRHAGRWTAEHPEVAMIGTYASLRGAGRSPSRPPTRTVLRDIVAQGQADGLFRKDVDAKALGLVLGSLLLQLAFIGSENARLRGEEWGLLMLDIVLDGMRSKPARRA
ncbi:MAG TPA: TetR family transcriptional regulator [Rhizomicrobium sp.]|jgi:AcrR family transcriptional regulator|nr:TetR family transcriptional regulator [Rhizomicrobium sp.]